MLHHHVPLAVVLCANMHVLNGFTCWPELCLYVHYPRTSSIHLVSSLGRGDTRYFILMDLFQNLACRSLAIK